MPAWLLIASTLGLLMLMVACALAIERRPKSFGPWLSHPATYTMALSVYDTGWAYFGMGAALFESGITYMGLEIGWILAFILGWPLLLAAARFVRAHRITTLPSFLTLRYGEVPWLGPLTAVLLAIALLPYLVLQLQALNFAVQNTLPPSSSAVPVQIWALLLAAFAILFGGLQPDPTRRLPGVFGSLALLGLLKLVAFMAVAGYACWHFGGHFQAMATSPPWPSLRLEGQSGNSYMVWVGNILLSLTSVMMLPHMFHLAFVEANDEGQVRASRWTMPLYGWVFRVCMLPITMAGVWLGLRGLQLQTAVLHVPGSMPLQLVAFLGGVAAASSMAIITMLALANMLLLDVLLPALRGAVSKAAPLLVPLRASLIALLAVASVGLWRSLEQPLLYQFGTIAWVAVSQLAPGFFLGLVWPRLQGRAVAWGIALASIAWLYTALLPGMAPGVPALASWVAHGPAGLSFLRPQALFGVGAFPPDLHAFFWCSLLNLGAILTLTLRRRPNALELQRTRELIAGEVSEVSSAPEHQRFDIAEARDLLAKFLGPERAGAEIDRLAGKLARQALSPEQQLSVARTAIEAALRGPLGPTGASQAAESLIPVSGQALIDVTQAYHQLEELLALSQESLANRLRELSVVNEITGCLVRGLEARSQLEIVSRILATSFQFDLIGAWLATEQGLQLVAKQGDWRPFEDQADWNSPLAHIAREGRLRVQKEATSDEPLFDSQGLNAMAYVPLTQNDQVLGLLALGIRQRGFYFSNDAIQLLQAIANSVAVSLAAGQHRERETLLRRQLESTLASMADAVMVADGEGRIALLNPAFGVISGSPNPNEFIGMQVETVFQFFSLRDQEDQLIPSSLAPTMAAWRTKTPQNLREARIQTLDGRERILDISSVPVLREDGELAQVVSVYRDVTELYHLKEDLEKRVRERTRDLATERDRLQAAIEDLRNFEKLKGAFVNAISHDLRIPLTGIKGYAELLEEGLAGPLNGQQQEYVEQILEASRRMTSLLNDMLDYARLEAGRFTVEARPVNVLSLIDQAITTLLPAIEKKHLTLAREFQEALPLVLADPDRVVQVLSNLLSNAIKFTAEGGALTVRAELSPTARMARVAITDSGAGISEEDQACLFERFFQSEEGRKAGGTGLGLSISKTLIEAQDGTIGATSTLGRGSTFWFTLPLAGPEEGEG